MKTLGATSARELEKRIARYPALCNLRGLKMRESQVRFAEKLFKSEKKLRALSMRRFAGSPDPLQEDFHPLKAIVKAFEADDRDESIWLAFLFTHFGWDPRSPRIRDTMRLFYGKFGKGNWSWESVCRCPAAVQDWMRANRRRIKRLKFGNHRKYETNNPDSPIGTPAVICSFVNWVRQIAGDSAYEALCSVAKGKSPEAAFDSAYRGFGVTRFGRTGKFDFLCLLGNLRILPISPPHCYLAEGTGPRRGAIQMVTGKRDERLNADVERTIELFTKFLGVPVEAMEDALCNCQKRPRSKTARAELGFVAITCG